MSIKFNDVCYVYSPKTPFEYKALHNINLEIKKGSFTAIVDILAVENLQWFNISMV